MNERITSSEWNRLRSKRWTSPDARRVLDAWKRSGVSVQAFAREHGLNEQRVGWWKKRFAVWREGARSEESPAFAPAVVTGESEEGGAAQVTIRFATGTVIEVADTTLVPAAWITKLVAGLPRPR